MLYKKSHEPMTEALFQNPGSEYRAAPFWAWNSKLNKEDLLWQIEQMKKMGFGGVHIHVRTGLETEYLGEEFFDMIKACVEKARPRIPSTVSAGPCLPGASGTRICF